MLLLAAAAVVIFAVSRWHPEDPSIPADAKARSQFVAAQGGKLSDEERRLLSRFLWRVQEQEKAGGATPKVSLAKAVERQRGYDQEVAQAQTRYQERLQAATAALRVNVREQALVKADPGKSAAGRLLRYTLDITNRDKRAVASVALRVEFRDPSGEYVAAIPSLELKGPLRAGETGRSVQNFALDPKYHQDILGGGAVKISAYPLLIVYADGERIDAAKELTVLESLARSRIE